MCVRRDRKVENRAFTHGPELRHHKDKCWFSMALPYHRKFGACGHTEGHGTTIPVRKKFWVLSGNGR